MDVAWVILHTYVEPPREVGKRGKHPQLMFDRTIKGSLTRTLWRAKSPEGTCSVKPIFCNPKKQIMTTRAKEMENPMSGQSTYPLLQGTYKYAARVPNTENVYLMVVADR